MDSLSSKYKLKSHTVGKYALSGGSYCSFGSHVGQNKNYPYCDDIWVYAEEVSKDGVIFQILLFISKLFGMLTKL